MTNNNEADPAQVAVDNYNKRALEIINRYSINARPADHELLDIIRAAYAPLTRQAAAAEGLAEALEVMIKWTSHAFDSEECDDLPNELPELFRAMSELTAYRASLPAETEGE